MDKELLILGFLRTQDFYGYQLAELIDRDLGVCADLKKSNTYYLLERLWANGWVTWENVQEGRRPARRVFHLTPAGEAAFQRLLRASLAHDRPVYFDNDIGLAFLDALPPAEAVQLLEQRRAALAERRAQAALAPDHPGRLGWLVEHQQRHLDAELAWLDDVLARVRAELSPGASSTQSI